MGEQDGQAGRALAGFVAGLGDPLADWFGAQTAARIEGDENLRRALLSRDIARIDRMLSEQVDAILHVARLRRLEGAWRGLRWLVSRIESGARIKVKLLTIGWTELVRDLARAPEFDQSNLFRRIYEDEFGMPGGEPYGLLVVDYEVRHRPTREAPTDDTEALASLASVAAAAFAPMVLAAHPALLDVDDWADIALSADPAGTMRDTAHGPWRALGERADMRFLGVALPRLLARLPWRDDPARRDGFRYREHAPDSASRVWMTAGYALAAATVRAHAAFGWPADVRGVDTDREGGGLITGLPAEDFSTDPPDVWARPPLDLVLNDRQERALVEAGLMPLASIPYTTDAAFTALRTLQTPQRYAGPTGAAATANARLSSQFHSMLCVSRFAHYVKLMGRDMVGSLKTPEEIEQKLQAWLNRYVDASRGSGPEARAKRPLLSGRVTVADRPGRPGVFGCTVLLQPHFQLEDVAATFRLTTELTAMGRAA